MLNALDEVDNSVKSNWNEPKPEAKSVWSGLVQSRSVQLAINQFLLLLETSVEEGKAVSGGTLVLQEASRAGSSVVG